MAPQSTAHYQDSAQTFWGKDFIMSSVYTPSDTVKGGWGKSTHFVEEKTNRKNKSLFAFWFAGERTDNWHFTYILKPSYCSTEKRRWAFSMTITNVGLYVFECTKHFKEKPLSLSLPCLHQCILILSHPSYFFRTTTAVGLTKFKVFYSLRTSLIF